MTSKLFAAKLFAALAALLSLWQIQSAHAIGISISTLSVAFGVVPLGTTTSPFTVTATAILDANNTLEIWSVGAPLPATGFTASILPIAGNCAPSSTTCAVGVTFSPVVLGPAGANLDFGFTEIDVAGLETSLFPPETVTLSGFGTEPAATPLPAALPLFATGLGALGLFGWRRKRRMVAG